MQTLDELLEAARRLPADQQVKLAAQLREQLSPKDALRRKPVLERWLARAGSGHSDFSDVSSNKNAHLAEISTPKT